ncbi:unnamed protein product [Owenia fusiformis]|uniref:Nucleolar protein 56 n=1 Tax=Owenia fusiformis TaxID=6347 RepID=A0A8S4NQ82_OWEFU|nr:unnamed protein product [Owenia fusiformis]
MAPKVLHMLFEHASGYALFKVKEFEEISMLQPEVEESVKDLSKFNSIVKLVAFSPFKSGANALDNINSISEGVLHDDLKLFLESNITGKKSKVQLGVMDPKLAGAINETLGLNASHIGVVPEVLRGIRMHFPNLIKGLNDVAQSKAQLGLGHSYSRAKVKFNVHRADNMIIQSISLLDQLDKDINTFAMRIREWYSYHFPELIKIIPENYMYAQAVRLIADRKTLDESKLEALEEVTMDSAKAQAVLDASRSSMGMDIAQFDLDNIERFADRVIDLAKYRKSLFTYLQGRMSQVAPNLSALIGEQVGARLISHAGSLTNLAKYPASTVQILGAEKALFRALKTKGNTPKYGLIFHSTFIGRAGSKNKGRISRYLANKCSIASRIDCFSETPSAIFGEHLKDQVEDRLKFYETGEAPKKNIDVMKEAMVLAADASKSAKKEKKKKKKDKKRKLDDTAETNGDTTLDDTMNDTTEEPDAKKAKKKKKKDKQNESVVSNGDVSMEAEVKTPKKKKKKVKA